VELVLGNPLHPYTKLLKDSVPTPVPGDKEAWVRRIGLSTREVKEYNQRGCKFADRCPKVTDKCRQADPPDSEADGRIVKCFLI
jgi:peptide/nickel transport system ATP-binding protein